MCVLNKKERERKITRKKKLSYKKKENLFIEPTHKKKTRVFLLVLFECTSLHFS